ncbi:hypothetical protein HanIR_Chr13g0667421 [Helianthus annuus]|nr:hypothetical protein HanIR_Chr13g0667421 [Helianthus annuus]
MVGLQWWSPTSKLVTFLSTTFTSYDLWLLRSTSAVPRPTSNDSSHDSGGPSAASTPSLISPIRFLHFLIMPRFNYDRFCCVMFCLPFDISILNGFACL